MIVLLSSLYRMVSGCSGSMDVTVGIVLMLHEVTFLMKEMRA